MGDSANNNRDRGPSRHGPHPAAAACTSCSGFIAGSGTDLGTVPSGIACQHMADGPVDPAWRGPAQTITSCSVQKTTGAMLGRPRSA